MQVKVAYWNCLKYEELNSTLKTAYVCGYRAGICEPNVLKL